MNKITKPTDEEYGKVVVIHDSKNYTIDTDKLNNDEGVLCPHDSDMIVGKNPEGEIVIVKKSFSKPFKQAC